MKKTMYEICSRELKNIQKDIFWLQYAVKRKNCFVLKKYNDLRFKTISKIFAQLKTTFPNETEKQLAHELSLFINSI